MGVVPIGVRRSFKVVGQEWRSGACSQWCPWTKPWRGLDCGGLGLLSQKLRTLFVNMCYFATVLRMTQRYLHSLPTSVQYEMKEKSIWRQKSARASNSACPLGTKVGGQLQFIVSFPPCPVGFAANGSLVPAREPLQRAAMQSPEWIISMTPLPWAVKHCTTRICRRPVRCRGNRLYVIDDVNAWRSTE